DPGLDSVRRAAEECSRQTPEAGRDLRAFLPTRWARESFTLAVDVAYTPEILVAPSDAEARAALSTGRPLVIQPLSTSYQETARALSRKQVAVAGRRLASVLNELFGEPR